MVRRPGKFDKPKSSGIDPPNFLGQHFMHNKKLIQDIVEQAQIKQHETVLELGAGKGALTRALAERAGRVIAVEYDARLIDRLRWKTRSFPNVKIIQDDILNIKLPGEKFVAVSNIPYAITTPILKKLLNNPSSGFQRGLLVMEKGAAKRFTSTFVKDSYVALWRIYFNLRYIRTISRDNFSPPPRVDSALLQIDRKEAPAIRPKEGLTFWALADEVLKAPRAPIDEALRGVFTRPQITRLRRELGLRPDFAVGFLSEEHWGMIFDAMQRHVPRGKWPRMKKKRRLSP